MFLFKQFKTPDATRKLFPVLPIQDYGGAKLLVLQYSLYTGFTIFIYCFPNVVADSLFSLHSFYSF